MSVVLHLVVSNSDLHPQKGFGNDRFLNLEQWNVELPIFRNFEISNMKIMKFELFNFSTFEFIFYFYVFLNSTNTQNTYMITYYEVFGILIVLKNFKFES